MTTRRRPIVLIVLDGWGYSENTLYNAIHSANTPVWESLWEEYPHTLLLCSGVDVGLPDNQMGNSEVGHMHIGAGRIVDQEFSRISRAIDDDSFFKNKVLTDAIDKAATTQHAVHVIGLLSPGGVHSHEDHIFAIREIAARRGVEKVYLHAFLDGRDRPPKSAAESIQRAQMHFSKRGSGRIASLIGRYFAMDRDKRWARTLYTYDLISQGKADYRSEDPLIALDMAYGRGETDEFVKSTAIVPSGERPISVQDGDIVIFANYRADRARQLTQAFIEPNFDYFPRDHTPQLGAFISLTAYSADYDIPVAFPPETLRNVFGEYISKFGLRQLRIAETEKYAHVTYFFDGGEEREFPGEDRILIPSPRVSTYDLKPEMSANQITTRLVEAIDNRRYDAIICNFANADLVGHSGDFNATVKAVEAIDDCLGKIVDATQKVGGELLITADHGNAEQMRGFTTEKARGQPHTAHTSNPVPLIYVGRAADMLPTTGALSDIAPTMLHLMGLEKPAEMTGHNLVHLVEYPAEATIGN